MKVQIDAYALPSRQPYENLVPIVKALIRAGNKLSNPLGGHSPNRDGFYMDRDGWVCELALPIDYDLIGREFEIPRTIRISPQDNSISDDNSWCQIRGNVGRRP